MGTKISEHEHKKRIIKGLNKYKPKIPKPPKEKNIPVVINSKLTIWTDSKSKIKLILERFKHLIKP
jgi:hypothetical protein